MLVNWEEEEAWEAEDCLAPSNACGPVLLFGCPSRPPLLTDLIDPGCPHPHQK